MYAYLYFKFHDVLIVEREEGGREREGESQREGGISEKRCHNYDKIRAKSVFHVSVNSDIVMKMTKLIKFIDQSCQCL